MDNPLAERGIFALLDGELDPPDARRRVVPAAALLLLTWFAVVAYLGPYVDSQFARAVARLIPLDMLFAGALTALVLSAIVAWSRNARPLALLATLCVAYVGGTALSSEGFRLVAQSGAEGWVRFVLQRLAYGALVLVPMVLLFLLARRHWGTFHLGVGSWRARTRMFTRKETPYTWAEGLGGLALVAGLPFFALMQLSVGFQPILSGEILAFIGPAIVMSLVNATVEEYIFRGFLQPAIVHCAGTGRGLWLQGLLFGLHHVGMSVALLATLPGALLVGVGSVVFGKSVLETKGLGWAIAAHAVFDIGIFAAYGMSF